MIVIDRFASGQPDGRALDPAGKALELVRLDVAHNQAQVSLQERLEVSASELSGGERRRLELLRALIADPLVLVCDEPLSALDVSIQAEIVNLLLDLQDEAALSLLFISHDLEVVEYVSHRVAVMYLGTIMELATAKSLFERRHHPYTRALLSAIPVPDPQHRRLRILLEGEIPSPISPPPGCSFHPRCPRATPGKCDVEAPSLHELEPGSRHRVACWNPHV